MPDKTGSFAISPALEAEIQAVAAEAHLPADEVVREALESYLAERRVTGRPTPDERRRAEVVARILRRRGARPLPDGMSIDDVLAWGREGRA